MKIAVFTDAFYPQVNGVVTHLKQTIEMMSKKHSFVVFAPDIDTHKQKKFFDAQQVETHLLKGMPFPVYEKFKITSPLDVRIYKLLREFNPDIIHFHSPFTIGMNAVIAARVLQKPLVGTFHTYIMEPEYLRVAGLEKVRLDESITLQTLLWKYSNLFYNRADIVVSPSNMTKKDLESHSITRPIEVVSNGVDVQSFARPHISKNVLKIRFNLRNPYFIYLGRVSKEKNIDEVVKAYAKSKIYEGTKPVDLVIVGDGPYLKRLRKMTEDLGIEKNVIFAGYITQEEIKHTGILKHGLCFITASTSETQGITFLEAMAAGLPIIGVRAKAAPELIKNNGVICKPHNIPSLTRAIKLMAADDKKRASYAESSSQAAKKHDVSITVDKIERIYSSLVKEEPTN